MSQPVIQVRDLGKMYRIGKPPEPPSTRRGRIARLLTHPIRKFRELRDTIASEQEYWAVRHLSFAVEQGEVLGVIGRNGAGKSTLLKLLSRITAPTEGEIRIRGRVASLLEVGTGFHPELTGRENVYMNGTVLGMSKREIDRKFDEIIDFSGVEKFLDTPVKRYSSGMKVRLGFSVAAHLEPEILIIDEVLAVGDAEFQKKCLGKMDAVAKGGRTVLFVSHNTAAVRNLCSRCLWLDEGALRLSGDTTQVIESYLRMTAQSEGTAECVFEENVERDFQLVRARLLDPHGTANQQFECDQPVTIELSCEVRQSVPGLCGYLQISRMDGTVVLVSDSYDMGANPLENLAVGSHRLVMQLPSRTLSPGEYSVYLNFTCRNGSNVDSPGTLFNFRLHDHTTRRGNNRGGYFSIRIPWEAQPLSLIS